MDFAQPPPSDQPAVAREPQLANTILAFSLFLPDPDFEVLLPGFALDRRSDRLIGVRSGQHLEAGRARRGSSTRRLDPDLAPARRFGCFSEPVYPLTPLRLGEPSRGDPAARAAGDQTKEH